jgi:ABC-type antimicrobial peptide transport system permease subunit
VIKSANIDSGQYTFLLADMPSDSSLVKKMVTDTYAEREDGKVIYKIQNGVMPAYESINDLIETLSQVFLYVGIGFAVFASLMLFNFITISISYKKREIGILRAVGARSRDVFNIFFAESFIIAMIAFSFAIILTFIISKLINTSLVNEYNLMFTLLSPGIRQILLVLAVSVGVAFISTFIPVYKIAMKRPIDAIRDR